jgi:hypothetical protein
MTVTTATPRSHLTLVPVTFAEACAFVAEHHRFAEPPT